MVQSGKFHNKTLKSFERNNGNWINHMFITVASHTHIHTIKTYLPNLWYCTVHFEGHFEVRLPFHRTVHFRVRFEVRFIVRNATYPGMVVVFSLVSSVILAPQDA